MAPKNLQELVGYCDKLSKEGKAYAKDIQTKGYGVMFVQTPMIVIFWTFL